MNRKLYIITLLLTALMSCHSSGDVKRNHNDSDVVTIPPTDSSSGRISISSTAVDSINGEVPIAVVVFDCDSGNLAKITFWKDRCCRDPGSCIPMANRWYGAREMMY